MIKSIITIILVVFLQCIGSAQNLGNSSLDVKFTPPNLNLHTDILDSKLLKADKKRTNSVLLPQTIYTHPSAFFCRMENKLAKRASIPVKIRLGSVDYVDKLEGK